MRLKQAKYLVLRKTRRIFSTTSKEKQKLDHSSAFKSTFECCQSTVMVWLDLMIFLHGFSYVSAVFDVQNVKTHFSSEYIDVFLFLLLPVVGSSTVTFVFFFIETHH